ncbi:MAG: dephospho-CoA kinase [Blastocatellia bacterium]|jgi:dephospho-CoA kinase|nr:dephospho-CoA kinase [Blastocatellia bacterium]
MAKSLVAQVGNLRPNWTYPRRKINQMLMKVGLTGSIAVGKSFVLGVLAELGCRVLDADLTAREVVAPGTAGLNAVVATFGNKILRVDGALDRARLGAIVFADEDQRQVLNSILHPFIIAAQDGQIRRWQEETPDSIAVIDAALMIESGGYRRFDKLIVVHCRPEVQLERLISRDGLSPEDAARRIAAQMPQNEKMKHADFLIDTSEGFDSARQQTEAVFRELKSDEV